VIGKRGMRFLHFDLGHMTSGAIAGAHLAGLSWGRASSTMPHRFPGASCLCRRNIQRVQAGEVAQSTLGAGSIFLQNISLTLLAASKRPDRWSNTLTRAIPLREMSLLSEHG